VHAVGQLFFQFPLDMYPKSHLRSLDQSNLMECLDFLCRFAFRLVENFLLLISWWMVL